MCLRVQPVTFPACVLIAELGVAVSLNYITAPLGQDVCLPPNMKPVSGQEGIGEGVFVGQVPSCGLSSYNTFIGSFVTTCASSNVAGLGPQVSVVVQGTSDASSAEVEVYHACASCPSTPSEAANVCSPSSSSVVVASSSSAPVGTSSVVVGSCHRDPLTGAVFYVQPQSTLPTCTVVQPLVPHEIDLTLLWSCLCAVGAVALYELCRRSAPRVVEEAKRERQTRWILLFCLLLWMSSQVALDALPSPAVSMQTVIQRLHFPAEVSFPTLLQFASTWTSWVVFNTGISKQM